MKKVLLSLIAIVSSCVLMAQTKSFVVAFTADVPYWHIFVSNNTTGDWIYMYYPDTVLTFGEKGTPNPQSIEDVEENNFLQQISNSTVRISVDIPSDVELTLIDASGKLICKKKESIEVGATDFRVSAPIGTYILNVSTSERQASVKFVMENVGQPNIEKVRYNGNDAIILKSTSDIMPYSENTEYTISCYSYFCEKTITTTLSEETNTIEFKIRPIVTTDKVSTVTSIKKLSDGLHKYSAMVSGSINDDSCIEYVGGFCWSSRKNPILDETDVDYFIQHNKLDNNTHDIYVKSYGWKSLKISGDPFVFDYYYYPNETIYYRAFAVQGDSIIYGNVESFTTPSDVPLIGETSLSTSQETSVVLSSSIERDCGAEVTERGFCYSTNENPTISDNKLVCGSGVGAYEGTIDDLQFGTRIYVRAYATNSEGTAYGKQIMYTVLGGAIKGVFSVSENKQVYFSQGNLQYQASTKTWRFAENQYDIVGEGNKNISSTYDGWIDLFGWGTSGYNGKNPYKTTRSDYYTGSIAGTNYDWGVYNTAGVWRTLTSEEWDYLLRHSVKGTATVNGVAGVILLPDNWTTPDDITFNGGMKGFSNNTYSISEWRKMEANGAVFLPGAGTRDGLIFHVVGNRCGFYWSSSKEGNTIYGSCWCFDNLNFNEFAGDLYAGHSVRLVQDVE